VLLPRDALTLGRNPKLKRLQLALQRRYLP
jgi:hypothetical protein